MVSIITLFAFAVAQPLFDLLGRNAEFFLARAAPPIDIVLVAVVFALVIPALMALAVIGIGRINRRAGRIAHLGVIGLLGGLLAVSVLKRSPADALPGWVQLVIGLGVGALVVLAYTRFESMRSLLRFAAAGSLVFALVFLFASSASGLVLQSSVIARPAGVEVGAPAPVVLLVFDEFPVASLMDEDGSIPADVFPNFARLAEDGTWFRNAITVQQQTQESLPVIVTGSNRPDGRLPFASDYPASLFSLLSDSYEIRAFETVTELCPTYACENTRRETAPVSERWPSLVDDLGIVTAHLLLPTDLTGALPPIDQSWGDFGERPQLTDDDYDAGEFDIIVRFNDEVGEDRRRPIARFLDSIGPAGEEPVFYFTHALVPHAPWQYLASGQEYESGRAPGSVSTGWGEDAWLVAQAYQRHLVQVQFADALLGETIDRLEAAGIYDEAIVMVLADHGITIRPNVVHRRVAATDTVGEVAAIPLLIKRPSQTNGGPDDYRAVTSDVVPTIADLLDVEVPWDVDGTSLFADDRPQRTETTIAGSEGDVTFGVDGSEKYEAIDRTALYFQDRDPFSLAPPGYRDLLGRSLDSLQLEDAAGVQARVTPVLDDIDLSAAVLPVVVTAELTAPEDLSGHVIVAVALNGEVVAVTRSFDTAGRDTKLTAMLPPDRLAAGENRLDLVWVDGPADARTHRLLTP
jgi:hypothetical protein